jgi:hypothetical protein
MDSNPGKAKRFFSTPKWVWGPPIHLLNGYRVSYLGTKRSEQTCPCGDGDQTIDHIIYDCPRLKKERNKLRVAVKKTEKWPISKENLLKRHYKEFLKFVNSISLEDLYA